MVEKIKSNKHEFIFIVIMFLMFLTLSMIIPFNHAPDEKARFLIADFMHNHHQLPLGTDAEVRVANWGISYAFSPFLSYMVSSVFMDITSIFTNSSHYITLSARLASVLFSTLTVYFVIRISGHLFRDYTKWLFIILCSALPSFVFVSTYVNNDALALLSSSIIIYAWIVGMKDGWSCRSCIYLTIGLILCILSYQNAYGYILMSIVLYFYELYYSWKNGTQKQMLQKGMIIATAVLILGGWFYLRNYILYNGDILGTEANREMAETYAIERLKPSNKSYPSKEGISFMAMLFDRGWIETTYKSFVGIFDYMSLLLPNIYYNVYKIVYAVGCFGVLFGLGKFKEESSRKRFFIILMLFSTIIPLVFSMIYSYSYDFQPQGRYVLPMLIPLVYFITIGWKNVLCLLPEKLGRYIILAYVLLLLYLDINMIVNVFASAYL